MQAISLDKAKIGKRYIITSMSKELYCYEIYGIGERRIIKLQQKSLFGFVLKIGIRLSFGKTSFMIRKKEARKIFVLEYVE